MSLPSAQRVGDAKRLRCSGWSKSPLVVAALALHALSATAQAPSIQKAQTPGNLKPITVRVLGRAEQASDGMYLYQWPGVYFLAAYQGPSMFFKVGEGKQNLRILLDGKQYSIKTEGAPSLYRIATPSGSKHTVRIDVINENQDAPKSLGGFSVPAGSKDVALPTTSRQIESIGDSHTVGYGNTSATRDCTADQVWASTDTTQSPGADVARHYHADYQINAISGHGVVRNYNGTPGTPVPEAHPFVLLDQKQVYHDAKWEPSILALSLGTNDFSTELHAGEPWKTRDDLHAAFEARYVDFVQGLRHQHPRALIVLWSTDMANGEIAAEGQRVVQQLRRGGDERIDFVEVTGLSFTGCHWHPSIQDDRTIAAKLIADIDEHPDAWQTGSPRTAPRTKP